MSTLRFVSNPSGAAVHYLDTDHPRPHAHAPCTGDDCVVCKVGRMIRNRLWYGVDGEPSTPFVAKTYDAGRRIIIDTTHPVAPAPTFTIGAARFPIRMVPVEPRGYRSAGE